MSEEDYLKNKKEDLSKIINQSLSNNEESYRNNKELIIDIAKHLKINLPVGQGESEGVNQDEVNDNKGVGVNNIVNESKDQTGDESKKGTSGGKSSHRSYKNQNRKGGSKKYRIRLTKNLKHRRNRMSHKK